MEEDNAHDERAEAQEEEEVEEEGAVERDETAERENINNDMEQQYLFRYTRSLKLWDQNAYKEEANNRMHCNVTDQDEALDRMLNPILATCNSLRLIKLTMKSTGIRQIWLKEIHLDFGVCRVDFILETTTAANTNHNNENNNNNNNDNDDEDGDDDNNNNNENNNGNNNVENNNVDNNDAAAAQDNDDSTLLLVEASFSKIYQKIQHLASFQFLHLRYTTLSREDEECLARVITDSNDLSVLFLGVCQLEGTALRRALEGGTTSIHTLALIWLNAQDLPIYQMLSDLASYKSIRNLVLLPFSSTPTLWNSLYRGLHDNTTLTEFNLVGDEHSRITDTVVSDLAQHLNHVKIIRLQNAYLGASGMNALLDATCAKNLTGLDLSDSLIDFQGLATLCQRIPELQRLKFLDVQRIKKPLPLSATSGRRRRRGLIQRLIPREDGEEDDDDDDGDDDDEEEPIVNSFVSPPESLFWKAEALRPIIRSVALNPSIEAMELTTSVEPLLAYRDFVIQCNKSRKLLTEDNIGLFPLLFSEISKRSWNSLLFHLLRERIDLSLHTNPSDKDDDKKKKDCDDAENPRPTKRRRIEEESSSLQQQHADAAK